MHKNGKGKSFEGTVGIQFVLIMIHTTQACINNAYSAVWWFIDESVVVIRELWYVGAFIFLSQQVYYVLKYPDFSLTLPEVMVKYKEKEAKFRKCVVTGFFIAIGIMCMAQALVLYFISSNFSHENVLTYMASCIGFDYFLIILALAWNIREMYRR